MNLPVALGTASGAVLLLSGLAHAFTGWPPQADALVAAGIDAGIRSALRIGWYFGSLAMMAFGAIVLGMTRASRRTKVHAGPAWVISALYLVFGLGSFVATDFNLHFLLFVATGVLVGMFAATLPQPGL